MPVSERLVYLDHAATTPMRHDAIDAMLPFLADRFANPSGAHRFAREARRVVDDARDDIAAVVGCLPGEIVFTSGGTESDNAAVSGAVWRNGGVAVCPATEHHGVLNVVERHDGRVVGVDGYGRADLDRLGAALDEDVAIVSVMAVNNEVGVVNDVAGAAALVRASAPRALVHTDAVQAPCWLDLRDALAARRPVVVERPQVRRDRRARASSSCARASTSLPCSSAAARSVIAAAAPTTSPGIVAMAAALVATDAEREAECRRIAALRDRLVATLVADVDDLRETVPARAKVAGAAHVCVAGVESEALLFLLDEARSLRLGGVGVRQRGDGAVARAGGDGRRAAVVGRGRCA